MTEADGLAHGPNTQRNRAALIACALGLLGAIGFTGCTRPYNPSFPVSVREADRDLAAKRKDPIQLERPVVVLSGYLDPGSGVWRSASMIREVVEPDDWVIEVPFFSVTTFDACRARTISKLVNRFGADPAGNTIEVDVVGISMGGLVARYSAVERDGEPRLRIARLFTISTPHRGAEIADILAPDERAVQMRSDSPLLRDLDGAFGSAQYEIVSYVRLGDGVVGAELARGPDDRLWWVPDKLFSFSHLNAAYDERIISDIVRRIAGEAPWTIEPCCPLPHETGMEPAS